ncbi:MAG: CDGSH iron-sulfur domain-containing protein [Bacteroidetes bacterium]|nr:CDGSH iron-sulfur domain-containing protein [Bacteroidota bacterium]
MTRVTIKNNGAIRLEGEFEIVDQEGNVFNLNGRTAVSLCRCGLSQNLPFCDGAHKGNFHSPIQAFELPPAK